jgi:hypothetical protein
MKGALALIIAIGIAAPLPAQTRSSLAAEPAPSTSLRPFFIATAQRFSAQDTFSSAFGSTLQPFWGGGLDVVFANRFYFDVVASRFNRTGERAFLFNGERFPLGIKLVATEIPLEMTVGYRFKVRRSPRVTPYVGAGIGAYRYTETSDFADAADDVDKTHVGYLAVGGVEFRVHRWISVSADAQYTYVPGILGTGGLSQLAGEHDLGGIAARFKFLLGR